jgi:hypothetical protein
MGMIMRQTLPMRDNYEQDQQREDEANPQVSVKAASIYFPLSYMVNSSTTSRRRLEIQGSSHHSISMFFKEWLFNSCLS